MTCHDSYEPGLAERPVVVVGVDGSPNSLEALRYGCRFAELLGTHVVAAYAYRLPVQDSPEMLARLRSWVDAGLARNPTDVRVELVARAGSAREVLCALAQQASMLVLGAKGHSAATRLLLGSNTVACAYRSSCPVLIVPDAGLVTASTAASEAMVLPDGSPANAPPALVQAAVSRSRASR